MRRKSQETATIWRQRYEQYRKGGLSRKEFCRRFKLKLSTLDYWFSRLRHEGEQQGMVELKGMRGNSAAASCLTLLTAEGLRLEIGLGCDMRLLGEVVRLLGGRA
jgi:hypothetical protein